MAHADTQALPRCSFKHVYLDRAKRIAKDNRRPMYSIFWEPYRHLDELVVVIQGFPCVPQGNVTAKAAGFKSWTNLAWWCVQVAEPILVGDGYNRRAFWRICCVKEALMLRNQTAGFHNVGFVKQMYKAKKEQEEVSVQRAQSSAK